MGKHKSGHLQKSMKIMSGSENDDDIAEMLLSFF